MVAIELPPSLGRAVGIGVDLAEIAEFEALPFEQNAPFYRRSFSSEEINYCRSQASSAQHFAARFAAKEAAVKAFSSVAQLAYWQIEIVRLQTGAPALRAWNVDRSAPANELDHFQSLVSLSHTNALAIAFVLVYAR